MTLLGMLPTRPVFVGCVVFAGLTATGLLGEQACAGVTGAEAAIKTLQDSRINRSVTAGLLVVQTRRAIDAIDEDEGAGRANADLRSFQREFIHGYLREFYPVVVRSNEPELQLSILETVVGHFPTDKDLLRSLGERLVLSSDQRVASAAALVLGTLGFHSRVVAEHLRVAIFDPAPSVRRRALRGFSLIRMNLEDELAVLDRIGESDQTVLPYLGDALSRIVITAAHMPALVKLYRSVSFKRRLAAVRLSAELPEALDLLLEAQGDVDSDVSKAAYDILVHRDLDETHLPILLGNLKRPYPQQRKRAVSLISLVQGDAETELLTSVALASLIDDSSSEVRNAASDLLGIRFEQDALRQEVLRTAPKDALVGTIGELSMESEEEDPFMDADSLQGSPRI